MSEQEGGDSGEPRFADRTTEHDGVALELNRALTAAIAGRWVAERIMLEIEARRVVYRDGSPDMKETMPEPKSRSTIRQSSRARTSSACCAATSASASSLAVSSQSTSLRWLFVGLTQEQFAEALGISVRTLQNWDQDRVTPDGPALALLRIAAREPSVIRKNLASVA